VAHNSAETVFLLSSPYCQWHLCHHVCVYFTDYGRWFWLYKTHNLIWNFIEVCVSSVGNMHFRQLSSMDSPSFSLFLPKASFLGTPIVSTDGDSKPSRCEKVVDCVWNVMAHAQKPDFVFRRNGPVHLNRRRHQFSRILAAEVCASAVVMRDTPCSEVVWRVLATHSVRQFPLHFPSRVSPCAITFQLDSNTRRTFLTSFEIQ